MRLTVPFFMRVLKRGNMKRLLRFLLQTVWKEHAQIWHKPLQYPVLAAARKKCKTNRQIFCNLKLRHLFDIFENLAENHPPLMTAIICCISTIFLIFFTRDWCDISLKTGWYWVFISITFMRRSRQTHHTTVFKGKVKKSLVQEIYGVDFPVSCCK